MTTFVSVCRIGLLTIISACFLPSCSEQFLDQEEATALIPSFSKLSKAPIEGYYNPFEDDLEVESQEKSLTWKPSSADAEVEVALDWTNHLLMFRSAKHIHLISIWDDKDHCFPADGQPKTSREYDYWVLEVGLRTEFLTCISKHQHGIHYRLEVQ